MMIQLMRRLWREERGETSSMAVVLITTILAFGALTGLVTVRNQIVQEFGDFALAIENLDQSFTGPSGTFTDPGPFPTDPANNAPADLDLQIAP